MYIKGCLSKSRGTCRTRSEGSLVWLLGSSWRGHGNSGNIHSLRVGQPLHICPTSLTKLGRHGCCLRGDKARERETEWMTTFVWCPTKKFGSKKWHQNNPASNGREETSLAPLLLTIEVTYIILKNKPWRN
jgi:hypothetical protein